MSSKNPVIFFATSKFFYNNKIEIISRKFIVISSTLELSSSSKIDNIIQDEEEIFKKPDTVGLPEVSKLTDSAISKRQGDRRKHSFLERKKYCIKGKIDSL